MLGWEIFRTLLKVFGASSFSRSFKLSMNQIRWMIIIWMQNFSQTLNVLGGLFFAGAQDSLSLNFHITHRLVPRPSALGNLTT